MTSLKSANRRVGSLFAVAALVLATVTPGLVPAFASAAQVTERSVALSNSSKEMDGVTYTVTFTPVSDAKAVVVSFCDDTPLIGSDCNPPEGFTVAGAATVGGFTRTTGGSNAANTAIYTGTITADTPAVVTVNNVTNPDESGVLYARIVTYDGADTAAAETAAKAYTATVIGSGAVDQGSAAVSITDTVGVSAAVLETMTFCVAGNVINQGNCTTTDNSGVLKAPTLKLGQGTGDALALASNAISEGSLFSQISTNAASGAVVSLKSSAADCGGLLRAGESDVAEACNITPALAAGIAAGEAKFGVQVGSATDPSGSNSNGTYRAYGDTPYYSDSVFKLNYVAGNGTGVTSVYGDPFLDTAGAPVNNKNVEITFGASVSNQTPAGLYSTDLSLIATGKF
jgi:hypothetical protein